MRRLFVLFVVVLLASGVLMAPAMATTPFIVKGVAQSTNPAALNETVSYTLLDMAGSIGDSVRHLINTTSQDGVSLTISAPAGDVIYPSISFHGMEEAANITITYLDGETSSFWIYTHQSGLFTDDWATVGSGSLSVSRWNFIGSPFGCEFDPATYKSSGSGLGSYTGEGYCFICRSGENWGIASAIRGGADSTGITKIVISSRNTVTVTVKTFGAKDYTDVNQPGNSLMDKVTGSINSLITLLVDFASFVLFFLWFIEFAITNLWLLVVDVESMIIFISCSTGGDRIEMLTNIIEYNSRAAAFTVQLLKGIIAMIAPAVQAIAMFVSAGAAMAGVALDGIKGILAGLMLFIFG